MSFGVGIISLPDAPGTQSDYMLLQTRLRVMFAGWLVRALPFYPPALNTFDLLFVLDDNEGDAETA